MTETPTKEQITLLLAQRLNCCPEALTFLFQTDNSFNNFNDTLGIPELSIRC